MSRYTARNAFDQFNGKPALVAKNYLVSYTKGNAAPGLAGDLMELASADPVEEVARFQERKNELCEAFGLPVGANDKPFAFSNGYAIIPIHGILINRFGYSWGFVTGYNFIRAQVDAASEDDDVVGIIYDVNSCGGMVAGCVETSDAVYAASKRGGGKPSLAVVDSNCYSAAYKIASGADRMTLTPSGGVGSIGVVLMHMDMSKMLEEIGITVTFVKAGAHKVDGNPYEPLSKDVVKSLQTEIDKMYDVFVSRVVRNRGMTDEAVRATEAACFYADEALALGLVDQVSIPNEAVTSYFSSEEEAGSSDGPNEEPDDDSEDDPEDEPILSQEGNTMTDVTAATAAATAAADARKAERERIQGIQSHAEAVGRTDLANHLAMNTEMSVEAAATILAAAAKDPPPATATSAGAAAHEANHFKNAMNADKTPNVTAGGGAGGGEDQEKPSSRILKNYELATGRKAAAA